MFVAIEERVRHVVEAQSRRFYLLLVLGPARKLLRRAASKNLMAELVECEELRDVAGALAAFEEAVAVAHARITSDDN